MDSDSAYKNSPGLPGGLNLLLSGIASGEKARLGSIGSGVYTTGSALFNSKRDYKIRSENRYLFRTR